MLAFLSANWLGIVLVGGMLFMHLGHGGHGMGHGGPRAGSKSAGGHGAGCGGHARAEDDGDLDQHQHGPDGARRGSGPQKGT